jgi:peptidoglycan/LPS O-acetylase OafA/YrhL
LTSPNGGANFISAACSVPSRFTTRIPSPLALFHFWSLAVEEQFYFIWPILLLFQRTRSRAQNLCLGIFVFACLFRLLIWGLAPDPDGFTEFLVTRSGELAAGGWLALAYRGPNRWRIERIAPFAALLGVAGFLASGMCSGSLEVHGALRLIVGLPCITFGAVALLVLAMRPGVIQRCAETAWLRWLGGISYGVYVYHMLFLSVFVSIEQRIFGQRSQVFINAALFFIAAIGSVGMAWISFRFFETPFSKLKDRFSALSANSVSPVSR